MWNCPMSAQSAKPKDTPGANQPVLKQVNYKKKKGVKRENCKLRQLKGIIT